MNHIGKILWIPADQEYSVVCKVCGVKLLDDVNGLELEWPIGKCEGPDKPVGDIHVSDGVGTEDHFGGA
jgi:hypothetical protein